MPTPIEKFVRSAFTNSDRTRDEQVRIHAVALRTMDKLAASPLRVSSLEPLVLSLIYLFFEAFNSPQKNRAEVLALLYDAVRSAKGLKVSHGKMDHNADHWIEATLASLIQKKLLRQTLHSKQRYLIATEKGESRADKLAGHSRLATESISQKGKRPKKRRRPSDEWFLTAVNLLNDGVSERQIAQRVGLSASTLNENPRWQRAKKVYYAEDKRPRHFEKRHGERRELPRERCGAIDTSDADSTDSE